MKMIKAPEESDKKYNDFIVIKVGQNYHRENDNKLLNIFIDIGANLGVASKEVSVDASVFHAVWNAKSQTTQWYETLTALNDSADRTSLNQKIDDCFAYKNILWSLFNTYAPKNLTNETKVNDKKEKKNDSDDDEKRGSDPEDSTDQIGYYSDDFRGGSREEEGGEQEENFNEQGLELNRDQKRELGPN